CFKTLVISSSKVKNVIEHTHIKAVTLTGSEYAGSEVASQAAKVIKKSVLELGGSDPLIVFEDADVNKAVEMAILSRYLNCGQSCIGAKRFLIQSSVYDLFLDKLKVKLEGLKAGNPLHNVDIGPLAQMKFKTEALELITDAVSKGAILTGGEDMGEALLSPGYLTNISEDSRLFKGEMFGPIASIYQFKTKEEAVQLANVTPFGLASSIWTNNTELINYCIANIEAGAVFVNDMVKSDPRLPFGGIKKSGYGRELAIDGLLEFVNHKTVVKRIP
ncbi:aldehyde dehydrogenase family protein, partial [Cyclobacteriaceae bacterium]|nr:aldehyde dehydrogenase family protein [Cyclobacteriaceae bacterium]